MSIASAPRSFEEANDGCRAKKEEERTAAMPFYKLFAFADSLDLALMVVGTIGAIGNGMAIPLMTLISGQLIDAFGQNQNNNHLVPLVSKVNLVNPCSLSNPVAD